MNIHRIYFYIFFYFSIISGQDVIVSGTINSFSSNEHNEFLTNSNVYDTIDPSSYFSNLINMKIVNENLELISSIANDSNSSRIHEFSFNISRKTSKARVGLIKIYNNQILPKNSSGHLHVSENTRPIYGIDFHKSFYFKKSSVILSMFNGQLSSLDDYNWNGSYERTIPTRYTKEPFVHIKSISIKKDLKENGDFLAFTFNHGAIWGGATEKDNQITNWPTGFEAFQRVFFIRSGIDNSTDERHKIANHNGSIDFYFKKESFLYYYIHYFEDGSGLKFKNKFDGLWGIKHENSDFSIILELLNTTNQSGNYHGAKGIGVDSYYWHDQYVQGWTIYGNVIGNHFIDPKNNRVEMLKLYFEKNIKNELIYFDINHLNYYPTYGKKILPENYIEDKIINKSLYVSLGTTFKRTSSINYQFNLHYYRNKFLLNIKLNWYLKNN